MTALSFILGMVCGVLMLLAAIGWARHLEDRANSAIETMERGE